MAIPVKKRFGDILVEGGLITATQLQQALVFGREQDVKLGTALQNLGFVDELAVARTLAKQLKIPFVDLSRIVIDPEVVRQIPEILARKYKVIAIGRKDGQLLVAFADPLNIFAKDDIDRQTKDQVVVCVAVESKIGVAIDTAYRKGTGSETDERNRGEESEVVAIVNDLLLLAVRQEASDIHIEPGLEKVRARLRVDGVLSVVREYPMEMLPNIVSRIKIMAGLDIGERRKPQDGRFDIPVSGREFDVRTSTLPLNKGEKIVLRLLDKSRIKIHLQELGFSGEQYRAFVEHLNRPHEIILVTGPTGSGKTTTLYGAINIINDVQRNIVTVEDPVEYELSGVNQVQVNVKADLTFSSALRSILRQDPDVVMIGEIRDAETAEIAIQAALTGHLVLSTLHTNDAAGAITRLIDMGIPPFLIASSLGLVVAQRLVRLLCPQCKKDFLVPMETQKELGLEGQPDLHFFKPIGCPQCDKSGYRGRVAIYEMLPVTDAIEALIMEKASSHAIYRQAQIEGLISLREAGLAKVLAGLTSLDEVIRVSMADKE
jgi:type IV pilus assembly protein PilB